MSLRKITAAALGLAMCTGALAGCQGADSAISGKGQRLTQETVGAALAQHEQIMNQRALPAGNLLIGRSALDLAPVQFVQAVVLGNKLTEVAEKYGLKLPTDREIQKIMRQIAQESGGRVPSGEPAPELFAAWRGALANRALSEHPKAAQIVAELNAYFRDSDLKIAARYGTLMNTPQGPALVRAPHDWFAPARTQN